MTDCHCKDSQITSLKLYLIVTLFVNFKHNFHKENETFSPKKLKRFKEKSLKMEPFLSELPYHIYDWLIISLKDFCIVIRKWPTFLPSKKILFIFSFTKYNHTRKLVDTNFRGVIDVSKASGPDCIPGRILQNLARELAPVLHFIFEQSLNTGDLPAEWTLANVAPIFKKGSKLQAVNY